MGRPVRVRPKTTENLRAEYLAAAIRRGPITADIALMMLAACDTDAERATVVQQIGDSVQRGRVRGQDAALVTRARRPKRRGYHRGIG